jgi:ubiquinone/menaquinone biosynthesis C-methylase UbiE
MMTVNESSAYFETRLVFDPRRDVIWGRIAAYVERDLPRREHVLEIGAGYCHWINATRATHRYALDLDEVVTRHAAAGVHPHVGSATELSLYGDGQMDAVLASNLFEHLTEDQLNACLQEVRRVLTPGGRLCVIQPNFRYCFRSYFDDYTHRRILTDVSLADQLAVHGLKPVRVMPCFLPFSMKSRLPKWPWLVDLYLRSPIKPAAGQMYVVAERVP